LRRRLTAWRSFQAIFFLTQSPVVPRVLGKATDAEPGVGGADIADTHIADAHMDDADIADVEAEWRCLHGDAEMSLVQLA
jgi:hypothetical protein